MTRIHRGIILSGTVLLILGSLFTGGCNQSAGGKPLTKDQEKLMRQPAGTVPMPKEAAEAMRKANQPPPPGTPAQ